MLAAATTATKARAAGSGLDHQDAAAHGCRPVQARDHDTRQEEDRDLEPDRISGEKAPDETRDEEAVVEPLVGRQRRRPVGEGLVGAERLHPALGAPQEHLEDHDVDVDRHHEDDQCVRDDLHPGTLLFVDVDAPEPRDRGDDRQHRPGKQRDQGHRLRRQRGQELIFGPEEQSRDGAA